MRVGHRGEQKLRFVLGYHLAQVCWQVLEESAGRFLKKYATAWR
jgi:hypothetical protein